MVTEGKRIIFNAAFIFNLVAFILLFIAFGSPYWVVSWPRVHNSFKMVGLWEMCFAGLVLEFEPEMKAYNGCWWVLAPEYWPIRKWLMPDWFIATQVIVTVCFVAQFIVCCIMLHLWLRYRYEKHRYGGTRRPSLALTQTTLFLTVASAILMPMILVLFGIEVYTDILWMPNQELNYLSWSYGLAVVSGFFSVFASIALGNYTLIIRQEFREPINKMPPISIKDSAL
ncbi:hypothetical protein LSAT2_007938 [Lamellibrachia satsuma]|nr:hypothetical protein LSAT2_007938 [Lamellibrachia satsuma]